MSYFCACSFFLKKNVIYKCCILLLEISYIHAMVCHMDFHYTADQTHGDSLVGPNIYMGQISMAVEMQFFDDIIGPIIYKLHT